jgi:hypothetical protein
MFDPPETPVPSSSDAQGRSGSDPIADFLADIWKEVKDDPIAVILPVQDESAESAEVKGESDPDGHKKFVESPTGAATGGTSADPDVERKFFGERAPRRRLSVILVAAALLIVAIALVAIGVRVVLGSSDGRLVSRITDRSAAGFEAVVDKTPTALVMVTDDSGTLKSATLLALTGDKVGGVMTIPVETDVYLSPSPGVVVPTTLGELVATSGVEAAGVKLSELLNLSFTDVAELKKSDLLGRIGGAALTLNNPSEVLDGAAVLFPKGSITLSADQVWPYLSQSTPGEAPQLRATRVEAFWKAWLNNLHSSAAVGTPTNPAGIDHFLAALASSQVTYQTLPVTPIETPRGLPQQVRLSDGVTGSSAIAGIVPFPEGAPGRRPRLRVVDGTGQLGNAQGAAVLLAASGGQVDVIGNAGRFGVPITQVTYYDPVQLDAANRMRAALGVGEVVQSTQSNSALDLTITLGADYQDRSAASSTGVNGG